MAYRKHKSLTVKHFFVAFFSLTLLISLGVFVYAAQSKTSLYSEASGCQEKPSLSLKDSTVKIAGTVYYSLKLINNCPKQKNFTIKIVDTPSYPAKYGRDVWSWRFKYNNQWTPAYKSITVNWVPPHEPQYVILQVERNLDYGNKMKHGPYKYFQVRSSLEKNDNIYDDSFLVYNVE